MYNFDFCGFGQKGSVGRGKGKSKAVICCETGKKYPSAEAAAKEAGTYRSNIVTVLKGRLKTAGGYHWEYAGGENDGRT